jgi:hypothetical protein
MKNIILSFATLLSTSVFAQEPPKFLEGFNYRIEKVTEDGKTYDCYVVSAKNNDDLKSLKKLFRTMKNRECWMEGGVLFRGRENEKYTMVLARARGFRAFSIVEN